MRSTSPGRLIQCRRVAGVPVADGMLLKSERVSPDVFASLTTNSLADELMRSSGYLPSEPDADPEPADVPRGPRPSSPSTSARMLSLTRLKDGGAILELGDSRIDFSAREFEVLGWMLEPKVPTAPASAAESSTAQTEAALVRLVKMLGWVQQRIEADRQTSDQPSSDAGLSEVGRGARPEHPESPAARQLPEPPSSDRGPE